MTELEARWQHLYVETNQIHLHSVTQGEGELVVLLHGFPEFWYAWRYQIPALSRYFKVVVPDLRGYNDSDKPEGGYDLDTLSEDIRGLIRRLGYAKAHIVGHDWGGTIAWNLAQKFPECIDRLAILNAPPPHRFVQELMSNLDQIRRSWFVFAFQVPGVPEWLIQNNLKDFVRGFLREHAVRKGAFSAEETDIYQAALEKPGVLRSAMNYYRQLLQPQELISGWMRPAPIDVPTLVLWGREDSFLSHKLVDGLDRLIAAPFKLRLVSDCGHWIQQEVPQLVNRELLTFLRS
ncbi:alpha/beta hydrolase [Lyngbya sp. CCY1209]|uniref:alpha/beta fold hydrolase n=1 Tax=Lyngbya sp. CCY1209 TaxID=2886103 RepID=UPI002D2124BB|nr:alpha/beta hydrolase [Lyngbya sp. CCY1209]MEB3882869.1 alpha/beta hydrolase [Lyngbya sp. CCY1209]